MEEIPMIWHSGGYWLAMGLLAAVPAALGAWFLWSKLRSADRPPSTRGGSASFPRHAPDAGMLSMTGSPMLIASMYEMAAHPPSAPTRWGESDAAPVIDFWRAAGPAMWFAKDPGFDRRFRERFLALHEAAARGELERWSRTAEGALALLLLLDQFPRNAFRGTPRMYATDALARAVADRAIRAGHLRAVEAPLRPFLILPFAHSEDPSDQERAVRLGEELGEPHMSRAKHHRDIVERFGRFPHRNPILGRAMRTEEQRYLDDGGYTG
jgi:uncharacterized protein (DUF924 family)